MDMDLSHNTILITGGATGIGLEFARNFVNRGNRVLICGRRKEKLLEAQAQCPGVEYFVADISDSESRKRLVEWATGNGVNILINNAGMQREIDLRKGLEQLEAGDNEIRINFEGTVYLTAALVPWLMQQKNPAIVNVSSALGFIPIAIVPIYCATKAATHSFTISLRHQLRNSGVTVFEVIPPTVDTELDRGARAVRGQTERGISAATVAEETMKGLGEDRFEIPVGMAANLVNASAEAARAIFERMNAH